MNNTNSLISDIFLHHSVSKWILQYVFVHTLKCFLLYTEQNFFIQGYFRTRTLWAYCTWPLSLVQQKSSWTQLAFFFKFANEVLYSLPEFSFHKLRWFPDFSIRPPEINLIVPFFVQETVLINIPEIGHSTAWAHLQFTFFLKGMTGQIRLAWVVSLKSPYLFKDFKLLLFLFTF